MVDGGDAAEPDGIVERLKRAMAAITEDDDEGHGEEDDDVFRLGRLLARGPGDPEVRRRVLQTGDADSIRLSSRLCIVEGELRDSLDRIAHTSGLSTHMVLMMMAQILSSMVARDPVASQGWRRYLLALIRPSRRVNRLLVRQLGYGILAHERALQSGRSLTDGIGPPVSASERRSL